MSNTFLLYGMKVQIFQRQVVQLRPDGGVQTMNLLDEGLMPYTRMNGSTFPAPDQAIINQAPKPSDPNYHEKTLQFVRDIAPDTFEGEPVNFTKTFFSTVQLGEAYPNGVPDDGETLQPLISRSGPAHVAPMKDPTNPAIYHASARHSALRRAARAPRGCCWRITSRRS